MPYFTSSKALLKTGQQPEEQKEINNVVQVQAVEEFFDEAIFTNDYFVQIEPDSHKKGARDAFLEQMPQINAALYSHLMQTLKEEKTELELKLASCSADQVSQKHLQRELWIVVGVEKFGLQSDLLEKIAYRFAEIGRVPKSYPKAD